MGWLLDQLFKFFTKDILAIGRKPVPKNERKVSKRRWQIKIGWALARHLRGVIRLCQMGDDFWVKTFPKERLYKIRVFALDGSNKMECLRIEIEHPNWFAISCLGKNGQPKGSRLACKNVKELQESSEDALLEILASRFSLSRQK